MTTDIEKQFFETFGIEPSNTCKYAKYGYEGTEGTWYLCSKNQEECWTYPSDTTCKDKEASHPQITDRILLELLCLINQVDMYYYGEEEFYTGFNYDNFKQEIISKCKRLADKNAFSEVTGENFKHQVQALFKEG